MDNIKLTQYSHGAGCGCKISPKVLTTILETNITPIIDKNLLVGNDSRDDAAVYDMGNVSLVNLGGNIASCEGIIDLAALIGSFSIISKFRN